ncbi:flagellin [Rhizobium mongolense]|uniref:flagellin N-terminal helical domain-containing protein n=1 Tax=Rhizobium mongolense TaxID=57676 RepID=UPI003558CC31
MTSILTNTSAAMALATLRTVNGQLNRDQTMVSSGYRISTAADNAAYWSISTTMKSDAKAVNAARDAMALGSAKTDTAYEGIESEISVVSEFKAKLVAAMEKGVDKTKVQDELDQLAQQAVSISSSASFNGQNWLSTDITDIYDTTQNTASLVSGFIRTGSGVQVTSVPVDLSKISLFNTTGGGALQKDDRSTGTIGGLRNTDTFTHGGGSIQMFTFTGPLVFTENDGDYAQHGARRRRSVDDDLATIGNVGERHDRPLSGRSGLSDAERCHLHPRPVRMGDARGSHPRRSTVLYGERND